MCAAGSQLLPATIRRTSDWSSYSCHRLSHFLLNSLIVRGFALTQQAAAAHAILAGAGKFEELKLTCFDVAVNAPATNVRKSCRVMNAHKLSVTVTQRAPDSLAGKGWRGHDCREPPKGVNQNLQRTNCPKNPLTWAAGGTT